MLPIEKFSSRLRKTQGVLEQQLGKNDPNNISKALDGLETIKDTLGWLPSPLSSGAGTTDQASIRMSRGTR